MAIADVVFQMPKEPRPLPSLDSDEESFVVLGKSLKDYNSDSESVNTAEMSILSEATSLIKTELEKLHVSKTKKPEDIKTSDVSSLNTTKMENSVVLPSLPQIDKGTKPDAISIVSIASEMSSDDIQNKISQLIDENIHLKETVLQNNIGLRSQYERIMAWQADVQKVHQTHKEKLTEAKTFIDNLKKEKEIMKRELTLTVDKKSELKLRIAELEEEVQNLRRILKEKEQASSDILEQKYDDNNKKIKDLEAEIEKITDKNGELKSKSDFLEYEILEKKQKIKDYMNLIDRLGNENREIPDLKSKIKELEDVAKNHVCSPYGMGYGRAPNGKECFGEIQFEEVYGRHQRDVAELVGLKEELKVRKQKEESLIMTLNTVQGQQEEYLKTIVEIKETSREEISKLRTQLIETQTKLTQVELTRKHAYAQISSISAELRDAKGQVEALQAQLDHSSQIATTVDEIFALKTQLELYKSDFGEERHAREVIKEEKDRLEDDLQHLQRRNQQLQEEIEIYRSGRENSYPEQGRSQRSSSSSTNEGKKLRCPKCLFHFNTYEQLEAHVNRCLEIDDEMP